MAIQNKEGQWGLKVPARKTGPGQIGAGLELMKSWEDMGRHWATRSYSQQKGGKLSFTQGLRNKGWGGGAKAKMGVELQEMQLMQRHASKQSKEDTLAALHHRDRRWVLVSTDRAGGELLWPRSHGCSQPHSKTVAAEYVSLRTGCQAPTEA